MHYVKAKGILSSKNGMNLYRGCSHGCIYDRHRRYDRPVYSVGNGDWECPESVIFDLRIRIWNHGSYALKL